MGKEYNLVGIKIGCDRRCPKDFATLVMLRETKNFYIAVSGNKFKKNFGFSAVGDYPMYRLRSEPITIEEYNKIKSAEK